MKKKAKILLAAVVCFSIVVSVALGFATRPSSDEAPTEPTNWFVEGDDKVKSAGFEKDIESLGFMENTWETAVPQTEIYNLISEHFNSSLPAGKTEKKAIVIGYDGCRTDNLKLLENSKNSGINMLRSDGGKVYFSYCGGVNYPEKNTQKTSTAPGWCSMLTGVWADKHGIKKNSQPKKVEPKTLLISLVEDKKADSSAFYVSWPGHFSKKKATYINEKEYIEKNKLPITFLCAGDDAGTQANVLGDLQQEECSDFIFLTLEYTDHSGHGSGFSLENPNYVSGFRNADATGAEFIKAIKSRANYANEDWLIIVTTDHGGIKKAHGGSSMEERVTFIVTNREIAAK